jgi:hypothetical protein
MGPLCLDGRLVQFVAVKGGRAAVVFLLRIFGRAVLLFEKAGLEPTNKMIEILVTHKVMFVNTHSCCISPKLHRPQLQPRPVGVQLS